MNSALLESVLCCDGPPDPNLVRIRDLIYQAAGIFHPDNKLGLLFDRCSRRMREVNTPTLREYFQHLTGSPLRQPELVALLNEITIGETCFFRNQPQLEALREIVLPRILAAKASGPRKLRIWSAGCSTGEEPYTLRMLLMQEAGGLLRDWTFEILGTDLNERSLACARNAIYGPYSTRHLTSYYRQRYFIPMDDQFQLQSIVRAGVTFSRLNLSDDAPMSFMQDMDVIFCCNVLIYFDLASKRRVIRRFYNNLLPHGYLFLGQSESLYRVSDDFHLVHLPGTTAYVKRVHPAAGKQDI